MSERCMKKHILIVSQYFYPEQFRINDIAAEWVKRGYEVTVLTGIPNYPYGSFFQGYGLFRRRTETYRGIRIIRVPIVPRGATSIMLMLNYLSFVITGALWMLATRVKADQVFIFEVSPMTQALPGVWYARRRNIPCFIYVQDLWPENVEIVAGISNRWVIGAIGKMVDYIYHRCEKIFTTSQSFIESIKERGIDAGKLVFWPQYADIVELSEPTDKRSGRQEDTFQIVFAGNIGQAQGLDILPRAARILQQMDLPKRVQFSMIGDGRYKSQLMELVKAHGVQDMFAFVARQPVDRVPELLAAHDAAFLSLTNNPIFSKTIPAKLQTYMACAMPILASADGETIRILEEADCGYACAPGDAEALARLIERMLRLPAERIEEMGANARTYCLSSFNKDELLNRMDHYFQVG